MADKPYEISVKVDVKVAGLTIPSETKIWVDSVSTASPVLKEHKIEAGAKGVPIGIMPPSKKAPTFLLINPKSPAEGLADGGLTYATVGEGGPKNLKPLYGPHLFFNGSAEWVTDLANEGETKDFHTLYFWNGTKRPITVQIVVGYDSTPMGT